MFRKTNSFLFGGPEYVEGISQIQEQVLNNLQNKIIVSLLKNTMINESDTPIFLVEDLIARLDNSYFEESLVNDLTEKLSVSTRFNLLVLFLSDLLKNLSTVSKSITSLNDQEEVEQKVTRNRPSLKEVLVENHNIPIIIPSYKERRSLYHTILAIRDFLVLKGYGTMWSINYQEKFSSTLSEKFQYDIAALIPLFFSISDTDRDKILNSLLKDINKSITIDNINSIRMGKTFDESEAIIRKLMPKALSAVDELEPSEQWLKRSLEAIQNCNVSSIRNFVKEYAQTHFNEILTIITQEAKNLNLEQDVGITNWNETRFQRDKYSNEFLLRLGGSFIISLETPEQKATLFYQVITHSLTKGTGEWLNIWNKLKSKTTWFVAIALKQVNIEKSFTIDNCSFMPTVTALSYINKHFNTEKSFIGLPDPKRDSSWVIVEGVESYSDDSEQAIFLAKKKVQNLLSSIALLINSKSDNGFKFGESILFSKLSNEKYTNLTINMRNQDTAFLPLDLINEFNPKDTSWGEYLSIINSISSPLVNRVKNCFEKIYNIQRENNIEIRFIQLLELLELLLSKKNDKQFYWVDRCVLILAGPNVPEKGYNYAQARSWLKADILNYLYIKEEIISGNEQFALNFLLPRVETMVMDSLFSVYTTLSEPDLNDIDDLILWYSVLRPSDEEVGGSNQ